MEEWLSRSVRLWWGSKESGDSENKKKPKARAGNAFSVMDRSWVFVLFCIGKRVGVMV